MYYVIEMPSNANTIFAGRVIESADSIEEAERKASYLHWQEAGEVKQRQRVSNEIAGTGIAATEIPAVEYGVISKINWDAEFQRRCNQ